MMSLPPTNHATSRALDKWEAALPNFGHIKQHMWQQPEAPVASVWGGMEIDSDVGDVVSVGQGGHCGANMGESLFRPKWQLPWELPQLRKLLEAAGLTQSEQNSLNKRLDTHPGHVDRWSHDIRLLWGSKECWGGTRGELLCKWATHRLDSACQMQACSHLPRLAPPSSAFPPPPTGPSAIPITQHLSFLPCHISHIHLPALPRCTHIPSQVPTTRARQRSFLKANVLDTAYKEHC